MSMNVSGQAPVFIKAPSTSTSEGVDIYYNVSDIKKLVIYKNDDGSKEAMATVTTEYDGFKGKSIGLESVHLDMNDVCQKLNIQA